MAKQYAIVEYFVKDKNMAVQLVVNDEICVTESPSKQLMIDLIPGWASKFPAFVGVNAGSIPLFEDSRVVWALAIMGGVVGKKVLELGPLEGGHTYMLDRAGAASITAIEANKNCFMRCLIAKEIMSIRAGEFLYGDFMPWLEAIDTKFDVIWSAGVLYHQVHPVKLLHMIGRKTDHTHIWTHYIPDEGFDPNANWARAIIEVEDREIDGRTIPHYLRSYDDSPLAANYTGGIYRHAAWLRRSDILAELSRAGLTTIYVGYETPDHPHGPAFALVASRT